jgi:hypothetical protein
MGEYTCIKCKCEMNNGAHTICFDPEWERNVWGGDTHKILGWLCGECVYGMEDE